MLRLWTIVFLANIFGAWIFALLAAKTPALNTDILSQLVEIGGSALSATRAHVFGSGVVGGWLIALVAWIVTASHWTIGQLAVIYWRLST